MNIAVPERGAQPVADEQDPAAVWDVLSQKRWLTAREAALYLSCPTVDALRCRMRRGSLPPYCWSRLGGSLRFNRAELDNLLSRVKR